VHWTFLELVVRDPAELRDALKDLVKECESSQEVAVETGRGIIPEKLQGSLSFTEDSDYLTLP
jgi:hypothetical protein